MISVYDRGPDCIFRIDIGTYRNLSTKYDIDVGTPLQLYRSPYSLDATVQPYLRIYELGTTYVYDIRDT